MLTPDNFCLGLRHSFADPDALVPTVLKLGVAHTSTIPKPRTTGTTTTFFSGFGDDSAFVACGMDGYRRGCRCVYMGIVETRTRDKKNDCSYLLVRGCVYVALAVNLPLQAFTPSAQI